MTVRHSPQGITISAMVRDEFGNEWRESRQYIGYSVRESKSLFKQYLHNENWTETK